MIFSRYRNSNAEEIFPLIPGDTDEQTLDQHLYDTPSTQERTQQQNDAGGDDDAGQSATDRLKRSNNHDQDPGAQYELDRKRGLKQEREHGQRQRQRQRQRSRSRPLPLSPQEKEQLNIQWQQRLACDARLDEDGPWVFEAWEQLTLPKTMQGYGGTDFNPVFDWINECNLQPDLVIYFTDAQGRFPAKRPIPEKLWLVKGSAKVPWDQRIQLN